MGYILVAAKTIKIAQSSLLDIQAERRIMHALSGHSLFPYCFCSIKPNIILMQLIGNISLSSNPSVLTVHNQMKNSILNPCNWVNLSAQVVREISYLHQLLLLHNDIKSDNVIIEPTTKRAVIVDFGKATTIEYPLTYCLNEEQQKKFTGHYPQHTSQRWQDDFGLIEATIFRQRLPDDAKKSMFGLPCLLIL